MKVTNIIDKRLSAVALLALGAGSAFSFTSSPIVVTAGAGIGQHDVVAHVDHQAATVTSWRPLHEAEMWILIDDGTNSMVGVQFRDVQNFIAQLPPEVKVGVGYMQYGTVRKVQTPTSDHEAAQRTLRLPTAMPGISGSPYIALSDFLHHLPPVTYPREIVLISSGFDPYYGPGPENPYLINAIHAAQKAGAPVHTIYYSGAGRVGRSFRAVNWGQNDLSQLSDETGGRFYWEGDSNPVALEPFFRDIKRLMSEQYVMELGAPTAHMGFGSLKLESESRPMKIVGPREVYLH